MKTTAGNEEVSQTLFHYDLIRKNRLILLNPDHLQPCFSKFGNIKTNDVAKFFAEYRALRCLICMKSSICKISFRICNEMFDYQISRFRYCKKFCKDIIFWCHKILKRQVAIGAESNKLYLFFQLKSIVKQGLGHIFVISSSSYFFNKTDPKLHLFKL